MRAARSQGLACVSACEGDRISVCVSVVTVGIFVVLKTCNRNFLVFELREGAEYCPMTLDGDSNLKKNFRNHVRNEHCSDQGLYLGVTLPLHLQTSEILQVQ